MATQWLRRAWLLAASASFLLAACGGGTESQFAPNRVVAFGDGMTDIGQNASGRRYTVNDGSVNNWTLRVADLYRVSLAPARNGGLSYATGNARVQAKPGAGGDTAAPTLAEQIDSFLAGNRFTGSDLVLVGAGTSDLIVQARAAIEGTQTRAQMLTAVGQAGTALGAQVRRIVQAGATHVVVVGPYNLGRSAWAKQTGQATLLQDASVEFNDRFKLAAADLGATVLYVDAAQQFNLYESNPGGYGLGNVSDPVCTSVDPGEGIGTGTGQVDSSDCTSGTVRADPAGYLFADRVYPTPVVHRIFGDFAHSRIRDRW